VEALAHTGFTGRCSWSRDRVRLRKMARLHPGRPAHPCCTGLGVRTATANPDASPAGPGVFASWPATPWPPPPEPWPTTWPHSCSDPPSGAGHPHHQAPRLHHPSPVMTRRRGPRDLRGETECLVLEPESIAGCRGESFSAFRRVGRRVGSSVRGSPSGPFGAGASMGRRRGGHDQGRPAPAHLDRRSPYPFTHRSVPREY